MRNSSPRAHGSKQKWLAGAQTVSEAISHPTRNRSTTGTRSRAQKHFHSATCGCSSITVQSRCSNISPIATMHSRKLSIWCHSFQRIGFVQRRPKNCSNLQRLRNRHSTTHCAKLVKMSDAIPIQIKMHSFPGSNGTPRTSKSSFHTTWSCATLQTLPVRLNSLPSSIICGPNSSNRCCNSASNSSKLKLRSAHRPHWLPKSDCAPFGTMWGIFSVEALTPNITGRKFANKWKRSFNKGFLQAMSNCAIPFCRSSRTFHRAMKFFLSLSALSSGKLIATLHSKNSLLGTRKRPAHRLKRSSQSVLP